MRKVRAEHEELKKRVDALGKRMDQVANRAVKRAAPPTVMITVNGEDAEINWYPCGRGMWMAPAIDGVAPIAFMSYGSCVIGYMNAFANTGPVEINSWTTPPGYARWYLVDPGTPPDPGTANRAGRHNAKKFPAHTHTHHGCDTAGISDANEPGGQGIYHTTPWATGCRDGLLNCLRLAVGWANRMPIFRLRRDMWDDMVIAPHDFAQGKFQGMDRTRTYGPDGYGGEQKIGGYSALDHAHLNRMTHPVGVIAPHYRLGLFLLAMLFQDVRASWFIANRSDEKVDQHHWWSLTGIQRHYEHGVGCPDFGRAWAGALQVLAWCLEVRQSRSTDFPWWSELQQDECLDMAIDAMQRMQDPHGWLYVIHPKLPSGIPSPRYQHKVYDEQWSHHMPADEQLPAFKGFEQELVFLAVARLIKTGEVKADALRPVADQLSFALRSDERTRQLMIVGRDDWSSDELTSWQPFIYGYANNQTIQDAQTDYAWWGDNPANSLWTAWDL